nr:hypothetical protein GCM10020093_049590 [Planobispora longispora]
MGELSRRDMLKAGGALGTLGALGIAAPAQARVWTWSPSGSVAARGPASIPGGCGTRRQTRWSPR